MIIPSTGSIQKTPFVATPVESVLLTAVPLNVQKSFSASVSDLITIDAPAGSTITELLSAHANIYPGGMMVSEVSGNYVLQFRTTIFFTVEIDNGNVILLSNVIDVVGEIGPVADIPVIPTPPVTAPVIGTSNTAISPGGTSVVGTITVGAFNMNVTQLMSLNVVINPEI